MPRIAALWLVGFYSWVNAGTAVAASSWVTAAVVNDDSVFLCGRATADGGAIAGGAALKKEDRWRLRGLVVKTSADGELRWLRVVGHPNPSGAFRIEAIEETTDHYIIAGGLVTGGIYFVKLDSDGNGVWQRTVKAEIATGDTIATCPITNGGILVASTMSGTVEDENALFCAKLDSDGNLRWTWKYQVPSRIWRFAVSEVADGGFALALTGGEDSIAVIRLDANGRIKWQKQYEDALAYLGFDSLAIRGTKSRQIVVAASRNEVVQESAWFLRLDDQGHILDQRKLGIASYSRPTALEIMNDASMIIAGIVFDHDETKHWVAHVDAQCRGIWHRTFPVPGDGHYRDEYLATGRAGDGGWILAGIWRPPESGDQDGGLLVKLTADGWAEQPCRSRGEDWEGWVESTSAVPVAASAVRLRCPAVSLKESRKLGSPTPLVFHACEQADLAAHWDDPVLTGNTVSAVCSVWNLGGARSRATQLFVYLSGDASPSDDDIRVSTHRVSWLPSGDRFRVAVSHVGASSLQGWYLLAVTDALNAVAEGDESNNVAAVCIRER
ncbi:MAG: CARDB domain-containing protein [Acidobacteriota bacterium]